MFLYESCLYKHIHNLNNKSHIDKCINKILSLQIYDNSPLMELQWKSNDLNNVLTHLQAVSIALLVYILYIIF